MNGIVEEVHVGDYVVDELHGIAVFEGLTRLSTPAADNAEAIEREFLVLEFHGGDKVYVPAEQADRVRPYAGSDAPALSRIKGRGWASAVAKAKEQAREVAAELAKLYTERTQAVGRAASPDTPRQRAMEAAFPYSETADQLAAIADIKRDLESPRPMDRILIGDVGYGKTEVAVRAAFKVVQDGRQVAVLCPTSVLAAQHFATFTERLGPFGVRIDLLSRFRSASEQQETLAGLRSDAVNVVVGTHRLLSEDVEFADLGLVVVDEEQRFGVAHKEKLKQYRNTVDVLTMTATPIPRTLQMSLTGLCDVSRMTEPPEGRIPVQTTVLEYDENAIRLAIRRELDRCGQAYFLHNRIDTLEDVASRLAEFVPDATFRVAHGQMDEAELEQVMNDFYERRFDVLVCTTIIEAGLDVSNANTLIVDNADALGLAQLYQLRGRVGRSDRQAFALFLYRGSENLTDIARRRLSTLVEFSDLGAGQNIALRDLELRGAGSLLGLEQSGPVSAIGLDLFLRLVESAVSRLRGEKPDPGLARLPTVEIPIAAGLPTCYIPDDDERLRVYYRLAGVRSESAIDGLRQEMEKRYGALPDSVENEVAIMRLRIRCRVAGVLSITSDGMHVTVRVRKGVRISENTQAALRSELGELVTAIDVESIGLLVTSSNALTSVEAVLDVLARALRKRRARAERDN